MMSLSLTDRLEIQDMDERFRNSRDACGTALAGLPQENRARILRKRLGNVSADEVNWLPDRSGYGDVRIQVNVLDEVEQFDAFRHGPLECFAPGN